ncbi:MAG: hypothetical protein FWF58_01295 [Firmicutes bacterium]|nr:hypothetical protein [Bacillota bacterium]
MKNMKETITIKGISIFLIAIFIGVVYATSLIVPLKQFFDENLKTNIVFCLFSFLLLFN